MSAIATKGTTSPAFLDSLRTLLGDGLITSREELRTYECDGLTNLRVVPAAVVLPSTAKQVQAIVRLCAREHVAFVARGSGTGLSGGALPVEGGIVISLARLNHILAVDIANARAVVEPGVINAADAARRALWVLLCSGPLFAIRVHHRRQCRGERWWRALPQVRLHHHARPGT